MNHNINYKKYGYTLLEILLVLGLLSVILSIAVPSIKVIGRFKEGQEMKELKRDMMHSRNNSILKGNLYIFEIDDKNNFYSISNKNKIIKKKHLIYWNILPGNNFDSNIPFLPTGSPGKSGTFALRNKKNKIVQLKILPVTGKINIYEIK